MHLSLAFVPPAPVLEHLEAYLDPSQMTAAGLHPLPMTELQMSMTVFGNVSKGDLPVLVQALRRASETWPPAPTVRLSGGAALEWPGDTSVWAKTEGDSASMREVARSIAPAAARIGFAVDRRRFQPWLAVARVTPATELSSLERLLASLDAYVGPHWVVAAASLLRTTSVPGRPNLRGYETVGEFDLPSL